MIRITIKDFIRNAIRESFTLKTLYKMRTKRTLT